MTITYTTDQEGTDALNARVTDYNTKQSENLTVPQFLSQHVVAAYVDNLKRTQFESAVARISEVVRPLPYADRLSLIALVESHTA